MMKFFKRNTTTEIDNLTQKFAKCNLMSAKRKAEEHSGVQSKKAKIVFTSEQSTQTDYITSQQELRELRRGLAETRHYLIQDLKLELQLLRIRQTEEGRIGRFRSPLSQSRHTGAGQVNYKPTFRSPLVRTTTLE